MRSIAIGEDFEAHVTQMRRDGEFGTGNEELLDGNMIPRLCTFAGEKACAQTCQLKELRKTEPETGSDDANRIETVGKLCAEENILDKLDELHVNPENFVLVSATKDRVIFGDEIDQSGATLHADKYTMVPEANGFYFRPDADVTPNGQRHIYEIAMRMADCGDVVVTGRDDRGKSFVGQGHFSRTNMDGPSARKHKLNDQKVSWGEYFIGNGVEHYNADVSELQVTLVAAVEGKDFLHHYENDEQRDAHFPGWNELGFMHATGNFDHQGRQEYLIDYREMIVWQLTEGIQNPKYRLRLDQIRFEDAINTGDVSLGHASHHKATHGGIAHGRDMYMVGVKQAETLAARPGQEEEPEEPEEPTFTIGDDHGRTVVKSLEEIARMRYQSIEAMNDLGDGRFMQGIYAGLYEPTRESLIEYGRYLEQFQPAWGDREEERHD